LSCKVVLQRTQSLIGLEGDNHNDFVKYWMSRSVGNRCMGKQD